MFTVAQDIVHTLGWHICEQELLYLVISARWITFSHNCSMMSACLTLIKNFCLTQVI